MKRIAMLLAVFGLLLQVTAVSKTDPITEREYIRMGEGYANRGQLEQAKDAYQRALKLNPNSVRARNELALMSARKAEKKGSGAFAKDWQDGKVAVDQSFRYTAGNGPLSDILAIMRAEAVEYKKNDCSACKYAKIPVKNSTLAIQFQKVTYPDRPTFIFVYAYPKPVDQLEDPFTDQSGKRLYVRDNSRDEQQMSSGDWHAYLHAYAAGIKKVQNAQ